MIKVSIIVPIYNVEKQNTIRKTLDEQIAQGSHSENNALMVYNPFGTNTLSMYTYFTTAQGAKISYTIHVEDDKIADFVIPFGAVMNMNGTAIYEAVTAVVVAKSEGALHPEK